MFQWCWWGGREYYKDHQRLRHLLLSGVVENHRIHTVIIVWVISDEIKLKLTVCKNNKKLKILRKMRWSQ